MTGEELEIEFLINHRAKVSSDIEGLKEAQIRTAANIVVLTNNISRLEAQAEADRRVTTEAFHALTEEMREGFNKLILSNEVTGDLSNQVARLAIETSQRVTDLEDKLK